VKQWHYADAKHQQHGPVDSNTLVEKLKSQEINRDTLVWREGLAEWKPLKTIETELPTAPQAKAAPANPGAYSHSNYGSGAASSASASSASSSPYAAPASQVAARTYSPVSGGEVVQAGFWRRFAAIMVDGLLIGVVNQLISFCILMVGGIIFGSSDGGAIAVSLFNFLVMVSFTAIYYAWFHASVGGATPGKLLVGIKVVRPDGEKISFLRGIGRHFATWLSGIILCLGYIMAAFTDNKQALHDMLADTWVVDKWAFTDRPELQKNGLDTASKVILIVFFALLGMGLLGMIFTFIVFAIAAAN